MGATSMRNTSFAPVPLVLKLLNLNFLIASYTTRSVAWCSSPFSKLKPFTVTLVCTKEAEAVQIFILIDKGNAVVSCIGEFVLFSPHLVLRV